MIDDYYRYICNHPKTKLILFYGCYSIDLVGIIPFVRQKYFFIVMNNLTVDKKDYILYDLKGSYIDRSSNNNSDSEIELATSDSDYKDNDYISKPTIKVIKSNEQDGLYNILVEDISFFILKLNI